MNKDRVIVIYGDTLSELQVNALGYNHDHCWHYYFGKTENVPEHLKEFVAEDKNYVFLCEEDEPLKQKI